jgi:hypothetical protein
MGSLNGCPAVRHETSEEGTVMAKPQSITPDVEIVRRGGKPQGLFANAESRLLDFAEDGKAELVKGFDGLLAMVQELAANVDSVGGSAFADYAHKAADVISSVQDTLRDKPVAELIDDGRDVIRRQPGVAIGLAVAAGFIAARLVKSGRR